MKKPLFAAVIVLMVVIPLSGKDLHWKALDVDARLDDGGRLHVVERQHFVFNGDWNGGERSFNIRRGQKLELIRMSRISSTGEKIDLTHGSLDAIDNYAWSGKELLRWRSRLPSDPPFENTELIYEIEYVLSNILLTAEKDDRTLFTLDHDFVFPDRGGTIEQFTLDLEFDPKWAPLGQVQRHYAAGPVTPGKSFPLKIELDYSGEGMPAGVRPVPSLSLHYVVLAAIVAALGILYGNFISGERARGRFEKEEIAVIDEAWLQKNVFFAPPEVIGALWDTSTDASEVAAMLARLTQEKKIKTTVVKKGLIFKAPQLEMQLLVPRSEFTSTELKLVDAFFFDGDTTDTERIRKHYRSRGFNPASAIRAPLEKVISGNKEWKEAKVRRNWRRDGSLIALAMALLLLRAFTSPNDLAPMVFIAFSAVFVCVFASLLALASSMTIKRLVGWSIAFTFPAVAQLFALYLFVRFAEDTVSILGVLIAAFAIVVFYWFVLGWAQFTESPAKLAVRKRLLFARDYFRAQLRLPEPALRDEWFPYIIAFGLGQNVDRWFSSFAGSSSTMISHHGSSFGSSSSAASRSQGGPSGTWSGGGTSFGGAGATGAWAAAAGSVASGVATPGSSSGGGGGGGSSSGGGGGGGW